jgi:phosphate starvation-inducible PhoH-like protein
MGCINVKNNLIMCCRSFSSKQLPKLYNAKTEGQKKYKSSLYNRSIDLIICNGPAGCGKTSIACDYSIHQLKNKSFNKIIISRPTISIQENLGYLPGTINEKMYPWTLPIFDIFHEYYTKNEVEIMIKEGMIEIIPLGFIQGRTFKNAIIIADEMQNSTNELMYLLLTRLGKGSKMIVNGDLNQNKKNNGLLDLIEKMKKKYNYEENIHMMNEDGIDFIQMNDKDIMRHKIVEKIIQLYK